jgi:hypothetical protein
MRLNLQTRSVILLAPHNRKAGTPFRNVCSNDFLRDQLQTELQRLRGSVYLRDGAIRPSDLSIDGRHHLAVDDESWHLVLMDEKGSIGGCARYRVHPYSVRFEDLGVATSAIARSADWARHFQMAVEAELRTARQMQLPYVEMGGWVMADHFRGTRQCLLSVLASYALVRLIPGALAICPATERNGSEAILRRMGGRLLDVFGEVIPPYFDAGYGCKMQMLRFDARTPLPRYEENVRQLMASLIEAPVICTDTPGHPAPRTKFATVPAPYSNPVDAFATVV